ncbi:Hypothetical protein GbCGDNIH4_0362 [Granulibacter bethesdensis CGDNIH4]|nr:Hypothetical protein GbCGDNIH4_0362 [Granulibacter bethesdensis CGDNIH4]
MMIGFFSAGSRSMSVGQHDASRQAALWLARVATACTALIAASCAPHTGHSERFTNNNDGSVELTFLNNPPPGEARRESPSLFVSVGGVRMQAVMDTGSTGVVISATALPENATLRDLGPAELTYSSSGRIMIGRWVLTRVTVTGAHGHQFISSPVPVLAVTHIACQPTARSCTPSDHPRHVAMLGIGFAREGDHQQQSGPSHNPFLNPSPGMAGDTGTPGYVITFRSVRIGLPSGGAMTLAKRGFSLVKLPPSTIEGEWGPIPACIGVASHSPACGGTMLMDTGVTRMFATVPVSWLSDLSRNGEELANETPVTITAGDSAAQYSFITGDPGLMTPSAVILVEGRTDGHAQRPIFVNTGVHFLNGYDYLYDAANGWAGFRPHRG